MDKQMTSFYKNKKVLVTGGGGFIGSHLVEALIENNAQVRVAQRTYPSKNLNTILNKIEYVQSDLMRLEDCINATRDMEVVFDLAAKVEGVEYNTNHPGTMFFRNSALSMNMLEAARLENVGRFLCASSNSVYSPEATLPYSEEEGFKGHPDESNIGYGWAKRVNEMRAKFYAKEFGMNIAIARLDNVYGPRDVGSNGEAIHVTPILIKKVLEAEGSVDVWGSGNQTRSFMYVKDTAKAMMLLTEKYAFADPVNIGGGEITIKNLVELIIKISGKDLKINFNLDKPEGQFKKIINISKMKEKLNWSPSYSLEEGVIETINWFKENSK